MIPGLAWRTEWSEAPKSNLAFFKVVEISVDSTTLPSYIQNAVDMTKSIEQKFLHIVQPCAGDDPDFFQKEIKKIKNNLVDLKPSIVSIHFALEHLNGSTLPGMMPIMSDKQINIALENLLFLKSEFPNARIAVENIAANWLSEPQIRKYIVALTKIFNQSDFALVLDVSNLEVMAYYSQGNLDHYFNELKALPIAYIHIGGFERAGEFLVDFHGGPSLERSLKLISQTEFPVMVEVDQNLVDAGASFKQCLGIFSEREVAFLDS